MGIDSLCELRVGGMLDERRARAGGGSVEVGATLASSPVVPKWRLAVWPLNDAGAHVRMPGFSRRARHPLVWPCGQRGERGRGTEHVGGLPNTSVGSRTSLRS